ncbi:MAG: discoidin domain-containing protein [Candidatus Aureabacteria bacterium]|nr:discoidin domain-containing protein [Candidatus Auribacterota bacterium]
MKRLTLILLISFFVIICVSSLSMAKEKAIPILRAAASAIYNLDICTPETAIDGIYNNSGGWVGGMDEGPYWITFDTGAVKRIGNVKMNWCYSYYYPLNYDIQISSDNIHWENVFTGIAGTGGDEIREINREARFIRLYINTAVHGFCVLSEFTAYKITVPHLIRFQGNLGDSEGIPLDGAFTLTFRLYDNEPGEGTPLWEEVQENLNIEAGLLDAELGSVTSFDYLSFDKQYWLSVQVGEDSEMAPCFKLTSVPYAIMSEE